MSFASRVVWITGASSGIGEALARAMLAQGAEVILSGRRADALQALAAVAPERTLVLPFETTDYDRLPALVEQAWGWRGRIDLLINNAGISQRSLALDTSLQVYRQLMEVDYLAPVALTQLLLPRLVEQGSGQLAVVSWRWSAGGGQLGCRQARRAPAHGLLRSQARGSRLLRGIARRSRAGLRHWRERDHSRFGAHRHCRQRAGGRR